VTIDARKVATTNRQRLRIAITVLDDLADGGPTALRHAAEWAKGTTTGNGGRGCKGDHSDPTFAAATTTDRANVPDLAARLARIDELGQQMHDEARLIHHDLQTLRIWSAEQPASGVDSLEDLNATDGTCPTCSKVECTGRGNDRLRRITTAEGVQHRMCNACRAAWSRRDYGAQGQLEDYDEFRQHGKAGA